MRSKRFYQRNLDRYFNRHYFNYNDEAQWYVDPEVNVWKFYIPSLTKLVTLVCDDEGNVREES